MKEMELFGKKLPLRGGYLLHLRRRLAAAGGAIGDVIAGGVRINSRIAGKLGLQVGRLEHFDIIVDMAGAGMDPAVGPAMERVARQEPADPVDVFRSGNFGEIKNIGCQPASKGEPIE